MKRLADFSFMFIVTFIFYTLAVVLWQATGQIFYLLNFFFIGTSLALGTGLWPVFSKQKRHYARMISQVLVGGYLFFGLGLGLIYMSFGVIVPENMQIEGFWV